MKICGEEAVVIAGTGKEGNANGKGDKGTFAQPMGICVELDKNIFITGCSNRLCQANYLDKRQCKISRPSWTPV